MKREREWKTGCQGPAEEEGQLTVSIRLMESLGWVAVTAALHGEHAQCRCTAPQLLLDALVCISHQNKLKQISAFPQKKEFSFLICWESCDFFRGQGLNAQTSSPFLKLITAQLKSLFDILKESLVLNP